MASPPSSPDSRLPAGLHPETLAIRMREHCDHALAVANWLSEQPAVARVLYPGLASHPQHELAMRQQRGGGALVSIELRGADDGAQRAAAWHLIDRCRLLSITANLGDVKSTITHPASTTHSRVDPQVRREAGISEGLVRLAIGLEHPDDIIADLRNGLC